MPLPLGALGMLAGGGLLGLLGSKAAKRSKMQQLPLYSPQQQAAQSQLLQMALQGLQNPTAGFEPIAAQARKQFQENTIPSLAERFTAFGGQGGQRSSAFQGVLGRAGSDLESQLAALQANYGLQRQSQLQNLLAYGLTPQFENVLTPGSHTPLSGFLSSIGGGLSSLGGAGLLQGLLSSQPRMQQQQPMQGLQPMQASAGQEVANLQNQPSQNLGQMNLEKFMRSGQSPLNAKFFNPLMQGY